MFYPIFYKNGVVSLDDNLGEGTRAVYPMLGAGKEGRWRWGKDTMQDAVDKNLIEIN